MKHWKEDPHLFTNGKFYFKPIDDNNDYICTTYSPTNNQFVLRIEGYGNETKESYAPKSLFLIARPISDMSDEEWDECYGIDDDVERFLWKIDHGFLPEEFGQPTPKDVIWRYENE